MLTIGMLSLVTLPLVEDLPTLDQSKVHDHKYLQCLLLRKLKT